VPDQTEKAKKYWFPSNRYGWGWGFPSAWEGWVTLIVYLGVLVTGAYFLMPGTELLFTLLIVGSSVVLVVVCWIKGEPPGWRWGEDK